MILVFTSITKGSQVWPGSDDGRLVTKNGNVIWLYCRLSPYGKGEKVMTVGEQEKIQRAQAKRHGLVVERVLVDDGISAFSDDPSDRPGFVELCAGIEAGECDYAGAVRGDRFARDSGVTNWLLSKCAKGGVKLMKEGNISNPAADPAAMALAQIEGVMGQMESAIKSLRIRDARVVSARQGRPHGGHRPFGYNDDRLTLHKTEAPAYRELFDRVIAGDGYQRIAKDWFVRGIVNSKGNRFGTTEMRQLLEAPRAIGKRVHHKGKVDEEFHDGQWAPIVTAAVQRKAIAIARARRPTRSSGTKRPARLLTQMMECAECGYPMRVVNAKGLQSRYVCAADRGGCGVSISAEGVERQVELWFLARLSDPKTHRALKKRLDAAPDLANLMDEVEQLEAEGLADVAEYGEGDMTRAELVLARKKREPRLTKARAALEVASAATKVSNVRPEFVLRSWPASSLDERRKHLRAYLECVRVKASRGRQVRSGTRGVIDLSRLDPKWS